MIIGQITNILQNNNWTTLGELAIQNLIENELCKSGYHDIKSQYKQSDVRLKNLGKAKPDIVLQDNAGANYLIEVKLQPDNNRGSKRFERSFVDLAYLRAEQKKNNIVPVFVYLDVDGTRYLSKHNFTSAVNEVLDQPFKETEWLPTKNQSEFKIFYTE